VSGKSSLRRLVSVTPGPVVLGVPISAVVAVYEQPELAVNDLLAGQVMVGASADVTVIVCVQLACRLNSSVAVQVMNVVPTG
jgi:hypothetical protein